MLKVKQQFDSVKELTREQARTKKPPKETMSKVHFVTKFNPKLPNIDNLITKHLPKLHADEKIKTILPKGSISVTYKRQKNLKELISPSLYSSIKRENESSVKSCNKCDISKNFLVTENFFICKVTGHKYFVRGNLSCNSLNCIYVISCTLCGEQYVGSATDFKSGFRVHKSDIKTMISSVISTLPTLISISGLS